MEKKASTGRLFWGGLLIFLGLGFLFSQTGLGVFVGFSPLMYLLPFAVIAIGTYLIAKQKWTWGLLILTVGVIMLLGKFISFSVWSLLWPLFIVAVGIRVLIGGWKGKRKFGGKKSSEKAEEIDEDVLFHTLERKFESKNFKGGSVSSVFGSTKLDLRDVKIAKGGADLDLTAILGSIEVIVPEKVKVVSDGSPVLGEWKDNYCTKWPKNASELRIGGEAILGEVKLVS